MLFSEEEKKNTIEKVSDVVEGILSSGVVVIGSFVGLLVAFRGLDALFKGNFKDGYCLPAVGVVIAAAILSTQVGKKNSTESTSDQSETEVTE